MSEKPPTRAKRRGWQHRGASSPHAPVALDGRSARGLLSLLEGRHDEASAEAREQLVSALKRGDTTATRAAMERVRAVVAAHPNGDPPRDAA